MLKALIVDDAVRFAGRRTISISGTLEPDDDLVLLILSEYAYAERWRAIVLDLAELEVAGVVENHHLAANLVVTAIAHRALRGQVFECRGFNNLMRERLRELFDAYGLGPPLLS